MQVAFLGTGSADGLPNPFCRCHTCSWSRQHGEVRGQASVLVDSTLLIDCGRGVGDAAARMGRDLTAVRTVLITHADFDHCDGAMLLFRQWARVTAPLQVLGPQSALDLVRPWLLFHDGENVDASGLVELIAVDPWQQLTTASGHHVQALPAAHVEVGGKHGLLWSVGGGQPGDDATMLYATDTGRLPDEWFAQVADANYDLVVLDETYGSGLVGEHSPSTRDNHLDLAGFAETLSQLRKVAGLGDSSRVVATHLGHHNPPTPVLREALASMGAELVADGTVIEVGQGSAAAAAEMGSATETTPVPANLTRTTPALPQRTLVLGGARSGKSRFAERALAHLDEVDYVATSGQRHDDPEWVQRVQAHRQRRPTHWRTIETTDLESILNVAGPPVLIDCLALWLTSVLDEVGAWAVPSASTEGVAVAGLPALHQRVAALVQAWVHTERTVIAVTNEVGSGVVPATASGRLFRDELGKLNAQLAAISEDVVLVVAGRALHLPVAPPGS